MRYLGGKYVEPYFAYNEGGLLVERMQEMGVPTARLEMKSRFDIKAAKALAALCDEWDIELIHCHYLREHYTALLAKTYNPKLRVVYTNHFVLANNAITRLSNRWMDKRQDQIIAVCNKGKEQLIANGWSAEGIQVVFNAVDLDAWAGGREESTMRSEFGIPEDRAGHAVCLRFAEDKGHQLSGQLPQAFDGDLRCRAISESPWCWRGTAPCWNPLRSR